MVIIVLSKIYFLYKKSLASIAIIKMLMLSPAFVIHFHPLNNQNKEIFEVTDQPFSKLPKRINFEIQPLHSNNELSEIEKVFKDYGLVNINDVDNSIIINLQYATTNNFLGKNLYGNIKTGYLQKDVVIKLHKAAVKLCVIKPDYTLVVLDAARPLSLQKQMWDEANLKPSEKDKFLANPAYGSLHNFGAAVDITLSDASGKWLDMGTHYDSFEDLAWPALEKFFLSNGKLSTAQYNNRLLLRKVMHDAGFTSIETEWWHFNACSRNFARKNYPIIQSHIYADNPLLLKTETTNTKPISENLLTDASPVSINFRVQIMTSSDILNGTEELFKNIKVERYFHNGLYKYTSGKFKSLKEAHEQLIKLQKTGFVDAFIVAFDKDQRIGIRDAAEILK